MSTDSHQGTLSDVIDSAVDRQRSEALERYDGAIYGAPTGTEMAPGADENCCRNCERELSASQARVVGDNDGCVPQCDECSDYHTVATAVMQYYKADGGLL